MSRSARRAALLARYKAGSLARVDRIAEPFARPRPFAEDDLAMIRAELHTLKGESRMLGLVSLAALAHELEDAVDALGEGHKRAAHAHDAAGTEHGDLDHVERVAFVDELRVRDGDLHERRQAEGASEPREGGSRPRRGPPARACQ